jgi:hypothetical protein
LGAHGSGRLDLGEYAQFAVHSNVIQIPAIVGAFLLLAQSTPSIVGSFWRHVGQKGRAG